MLTCPTTLTRATFAGVDDLESFKRGGQRREKTVVIAAEKHIPENA